MLLLHQESTKAEDWARNISDSILQTRMLRPQNSSGTIATTTHMAFQTSFKSANRDPEDWGDRMSIPKGETVTAL